MMLEINGLSNKLTMETRLSVCLCVCLLCVPVESFLFGLLLLQFLDPVLQPDQVWAAKHQAL